MNKVGKCTKNKGFRARNKHGLLIFRCKFGVHMYQPADILAMAYRQPIMQDQLELLQEKEQQIPGSVQYVIMRHRKHPQWSPDDLGMMLYHYKKEEPAENYLELRFCIAGNVYCMEKSTECDSCKFNASRNCSSRIESVDVLSFRFSPVHLSQFIKPRRISGTLTDAI